MSFTLAILIVLALGVAGLGLVAYHLTARLHLLERAVQGGIDPPSRRLGREEFERRFAIASERSRLAEHFEAGVVVVLGPEAGPDHPISATLAHLGRPDGVHLLLTEPGVMAAPAGFDPGSLPSLDELGLEMSRLGIATTPYGFVLDERRVRAARPLGGATDLNTFLAEFT